MENNNHRLKKLSQLYPNIFKCMEDGTEWYPKYCEHFYKVVLDKDQPECLTAVVEGLDDTVAFIHLRCDRQLTKTILLYQIKMLREFIKYCREVGITTIMVQSPNDDDCRIKHRLFFGFEPCHSQDGLLLYKMEI